MEFATRVWDGIGESFRWLGGVLLGEWNDERSTSQIVTDALAGFIPGVGSVMTLRDLLAVIFRLAKYPEKRDDIEEWILLIAMLLPLVLTVVGAVFAGIGALVGAEVGAFLRALVLLLVKKGGVGLKALVEFFQAYGYGNVVKALRQVKFASYKNEILREFGKQIDRLQTVIADLRQRLAQVKGLPDWFPGQQSANAAAARLKQWSRQLEELRSKANEMIPKALQELDERLAQVLAGDIKAATHSTHTLSSGLPAPNPGKLSTKNDSGMLKNSQPPEPHNTRRLPERRIVRLAGNREYTLTDINGLPVGAKPYKPGQKLENPALESGPWRRKFAPKVKEGYPNLAKANSKGEPTTTYATFRSLRPVSFPAGSQTKLPRVVSWDKAAMDEGSFYTRKLPVDGAELRSGSSVKEAWNKDGEYIELSIPPKGDPVWKELHALQQKAAGSPVPYKEELKAWEGPAASQFYEISENGTKRRDTSYLQGGASQLYFDRDQIALLKARGFISERKPTNFPDFDPQIKNIVPKEGPMLEILPLDEAMPPAKP